MPDTCLHCGEDGHGSPLRRPWGVYVGAERDGDGQPTTIHVAPSNGAHVAESDAEWLRALINGDQTSASQAVDEILAPLKAHVGVAEYEWQAAARRAERAEADIARVRALHEDHEGRCTLCLEPCDCFGQAVADDAEDDLEELGLRWSECPHGNAPYPCPTIAAFDQPAEQTGGSDG